MFKKYIFKRLSLFLLLVFSFFSIHESLGQKPVIKLGILPTNRARVLIKKYRPLAKYIEKKAGVTIKLVYYTDFENTMLDLLMRDTDLAVLNPVLYLKSRKRGVVPLVVPTEKGSASYRTTIITSNKSKLTAPDQLRGKTFGFVSKFSTSGYVVPLHILKEAGVAREDLGGYRFFGSQGAVARQVLSGNIDAGAVTEAVYKQYKDKHGGLRQLKLSEPVPGRIICARKGLDPELLQKVKNAILELKLNDAGAKKVLTALSPECDGFIDGNKVDYSVIENFLAEK